MFPKRLNETRKIKGFTAQQMSEKLSIGLRSYRNYESGDSFPSLETLVKIADILDVSTDYLLGRDDAKPDPIELLNGDEMEKRLVKSYFSVPPKLRAEFLKSMLQEYMKQEGITQTTKENNSE